MIEWHKRFSHLYMEEGAEDYPLARLIAARLPKAQRVRIKDYKDVFARPGQNFQLQKQSPKLILAVKKDRFLYAGSEASQDFGYRNFFYNTLLLNCVYNCDYCYLQGMYPSANLVAFVNEEDFFDATLEAIENREFPDEPLYLCVSYDTDLLAYEAVVPYTRRFIEFARKNEDLLIEIRTKSANWRALRDLEVNRRSILAWTLSPPAVAERYEKLTPGPERRLVAIERCLEQGWPVRLCFDPVLRIPNWQEVYKVFFEEVFNRISGEEIRDVSLGVFRMNSTFFKKMRKQRKDSDILYHPFEKTGSMVSYSVSERQEMAGYLKTLLGDYLPANKIETWF